jgi:hypothetical protein
MVDLPDNPLQNSNLELAHLLQLDLQNPADPKARPLQLERKDLEDAAPKYAPIHCTSGKWFSKIARTSFNRLSK